MHQEDWPRPLGSDTSRWRQCSPSDGLDGSLPHVSSPLGEAEHVRALRIFGATCGAALGRHWLRPVRRKGACLGLSGWGLTVFDCQLVVDEYQPKQDNGNAWNGRTEADGKVLRHLVPRCLPGFWRCPALLRRHPSRLGHGFSLLDLGVANVETPSLA